MYNHKSWLQAVESVIASWYRLNIDYPPTTTQIFSDPSLTNQEAQIANQFADYRRRLMVPSDPPWTFS